MRARILIMRTSSAIISAIAAVITTIALGCAAKTPPPQPAGAPVPPAVQTVDQGPQVSTDEIASRLLTAINQRRATEGLPAFASTPTLADSAREHNAKMIDGKFLATRGADEADPVTRITSHGTKTLKLGEDVGRLKTRPDRVADDALSIWMAAAANRKNVLSSTFTKVGIAVALAPDGDYYITADFAQ